MGAIGSIRKHSWIAVVVVGIAIIAFIIGDMQGKSGRRNTFAKIDGNEISYDYFNSKVSEREDNLKRMGYTYNDYAVREEIWQQIVSEQLIGEEMDLLGIQVGPKEMNDMFTGRFIPQSLKEMFTDPQSGVYNRDYVNNIISQLPQMPDTMEFKHQWLELENSVRESRQQEKYSTMLASGLYMPKAIADKIMSIDTKASDVRVAALPYYQNSNVELNLTDADYQTYFDNHKKELNYRFFSQELGNNIQEMREVVYTVFTARPSQEDDAAITNEVNEWWNEMQALEGKEFTNFVFMHSTPESFDTLFHASDYYAAPLDTIISHTAAGSLIAPQRVSTIAKNDVQRYTYGEYVMGKVEKIEMRPDSVRVSIIFIPTQNAGQGITTTVEQAKANCDSAMALIGQGMPFEEAVRRFSIDTTKGGDMDWREDGTFYAGKLNEEIINHQVGQVFTHELPNDGGYYIVKVTDKTAPRTKYRLALAVKPIEPSANTVKAVNDQANLFASQYTTCNAMVEGAQSQNLQWSSEHLIMLSASLRQFSDTRDAVKWAFDEETHVGQVSGAVYRSDYNYIVVGLKDVFVPDNLTMEQTRSLIEQPLRIEKLGETLQARAEEAMKGSKDINAIAANLGVQVDTLTGVSFYSQQLGGYGMEPKATATIAAKNGNGILNPVRGASGVYVISVDNSVQKEAQPSENLCRNFEQACMSAVFDDYQSGRRSEVVNILKNKVKIVDNRAKYL